MCDNIPYLTNNDIEIMKAQLRIQVEKEVREQVLKEMGEEMSRKIKGQWH